MKGNLKSWVFMFAVAGVIVLAAACGSKGDTGAAGTSNCPSIGSGDLNAPVTTYTKSASASTFTLICTDTAAVVSGATTISSGCGNTYYSDNGGAWTLTTSGTAIPGTATHVYRYFSYDKACNAEAINTAPAF